MENGPPTALPSFITGEPKPSSSEGENLPVSEQTALPAPQNPPEAGAGPDENAPGDAPFPGRGRRRRLRSPYGFNARQATEDESDAPNANTVGDETPASE